MLGKAIEPEIGEMIAARQFDTIREQIAELEVADVAEIIEDLPASDQAVVFRILPRELAADVFEHMPLETQEILLRNFSVETVGEILNAMAPDDRTRLLEEVPGSVTQRLLKMLNPEELRVARTLLGYPEESIGRLMTPEYVAAKPDWTIRQTLDFIRKEGAEAETITYIYIVDDRGRLIDDLHLGQLVMADPDSSLRDISDEQYVALAVHDDREVAVEVFKKYDRFALPVTDGQGVLLGIVTIDDVLDVEEDEATEDVQKFGGQAAVEDSYFHASNATLIQKRAGWLTLLFLGGLVTAWIFQRFESLAAEFVALSFFAPLVLSSGGNSGSQSAAMIIRSLATREVEFKDWLRVFKRELLIGLSLGCFLGLIFLLRVFWSEGAAFGFVAFVSVTLIVTLGTLLGALMPFFFKRMGFDPAISSSPFIATFVDLSGIYLYLRLAEWVL